HRYLHSFPTRRSSDLVECDSIRMRNPCFCATLIHGSMRLAAATLPVRKASSRLGIDPALVVLMCSGARKPSISFSVVKCEPLFRSEEHTSELQSPCNL